jgi:hypothetical protein
MATPAAAAPATARWDGAPDSGGTSVNNKWSTASNWVGDTPPSTGDTLEFPTNAAVRSAVNDFPSLTTFGAIRITQPVPSSNSFTLSGNALKLTSGITANSTGSAISLEIHLAADVAFDVTGSATVGSDIALDGHRLTFTGSGYLILVGILEPGLAPATDQALRIAMTDSGVVESQLSGASVPTVTALASGTLSIGPSTAWPASIDVQGGRLTGGAVSGSLTASGAGTIAVDRAGSIVLSPQSIWKGIKTGTFGSISLGGARIGLDSSWCGPCTEGTWITLIDNQGSYIVGGSFSNTNSWNRFEADGKFFEVSYDRSVGGDVTIRVVRELVPLRQGYWMVGSTGDVYAFGDAHTYGTAPMNDAVDLEPTPTGRGYWIVNSAGAVYSFGDAGYLGGSPTLRPFERVTAISGTPSGDGYWLFTSLGRVINYGAAQHYGDMSTTRLNGPVLDSVVTPSGHGYYMVASDGGIFTFGDAAFYGSMGNVRLNQPVQSLVPDPDGRGYWLVASDGGIFAFESNFYGSMGATRLNRPVTGMVGFGLGYLMVAEDGGIFTFGEAPFKGSLGANPPAQPIVSTAVLNQP